MSKAYLKIHGSITPNNQVVKMLAKKMPIFSKKLITETLNNNPELWIDAIMSLENLDHLLILQEKISHLSRHDKELSRSWYKSGKESLIDWPREFINFRTKRRRFSNKYTKIDRRASNYMKQFYEDQEQEKKEQEKKEQEKLKQDQKEQRESRKRTRHN